MLVNVIGLGYIGLPTSLILASKGVKVTGTDINLDIVEKLKSNKVSFEESGLQDLFDKAVSNGFNVTTKPIGADMYIVTVPTPYDSNTKQIDPSYLVKAIEGIIDILDRETILVIESTVSPGTIDTIVRKKVEKSKHKINIVHAPERILPGSMIDELINNSRTIGADDIEVANTVQELYKNFCAGEIVITDIRTAEMSKVVENTFRDINIAFANELAMLCHKSNLDVYEVIKIANKHPRVNILQPGPGVGGHCISVDPWFLVGDFPDDTKLILQARNTNDSMPRYILQRIKEIMFDSGITDFSKVGLYGLTYKENVDDTRESPTLQLLNILSTRESSMVTYDPFISKRIVPNQFFDFNDFIDNIELLVVLVGHDQIRNEQISNKIIFDTKNVLNASDAHKL